MKTLTLTQPWASLVAIGAKHIETRSWKTAYRGPLAIHAAKGFPGEAKRFCEARIVLEALGWKYADHPQSSWFQNQIKALPVGMVIATCDLIDCKEIVRAMSPGDPEEVARRSCMIAPPAPELYFGNYEPGRYGWLLANVKMLPEPIPAKGALSLWEWEPNR